MKLYRKNGFPLNLNDFKKEWQAIYDDVQNDNTLELKDKWETLNAEQKKLEEKYKSTGKIKYPGTLKTLKKIIDTYGCDVVSFGKDENGKFICIIENLGD